MKTNLNNLTDSTIENMVAEAFKLNITKSTIIQSCIKAGMTTKEIEAETGYDPTHIRRIGRRHFSVVEDLTSAV